LAELLLELAPFDVSCGQLSLDELLLLFELPLPIEVLELADGDAVCANACVTPTPPTKRPVASAIATAPRRTLLVISDHLLPSSATSTSPEPGDRQGTERESSVKVSARDRRRTR
jgi:hypothetical protein